MGAMPLEKIAFALRWAGRGLALLLVLFWGAFFVEHVAEWFLGPPGGSPPVQVWVSQLFHLLMIVGLFIMLRWDRLGALVTALGTIAFFTSIGYRGTPMLPLLNLIPIACFAVVWFLDRPEIRGEGAVSPGARAP
jgi:hypothetical protein